MDNFMFQKLMAVKKEEEKRLEEEVMSKDTEIERILRYALWHEGIRYRKNYAKLPGKPDIVLS